MRGQREGLSGVSEKTILLVEDDRDQVTLAMRAPRKHGIVEEVVVAGDGAEALDYLFGEGSYADRDTTTMPEFVLLDVHLPKMDGLQVLERLREDERTELVPVILFSSSREDYGRGLQFGVTKPVNFDRFSEAMRYLGWYWLNLNESPEKWTCPACLGHDLPLLLVSRSTDRGIIFTRGEAAHPSNGVLSVFGGLRTVGPGWLLAALEIRLELDPGEGVYDVLLLDPRAAGLGDAELREA